MSDLGLTRQEVLDRLRSAVMRDLRVAIPATVKRYDAATQKVDVAPQIADWFPSEGGDVEQAFPPVVTNVPVLFPGAGGYRITFPIAVGDTVDLLVNDRSLDAWLAQGGRQVPGDLRRHNLSDAVALPGLHDDKHAWTGASTTDMTLGKDGGAQVVVKSASIELAGNAEPVAKADSVKAELERLWTALSLHVHTSATAGNPTSTPVTLPTTPATNLAGSVASSKVKVGS
jgi:hypothetical protein